MNRCPVLFLFLITSVLFAVPAARAQGLSCDQCTSDMACSTQCWVCNPPEVDYCPQNNVVWQTCGDFTTNCSNCDPNPVLVSRTKIGGEVTDVYCFIGCECHNVSYYLATYHDTNNCQPDFTQCETDAVDYYAYHSDECCAYTDPSDISHSDYCGGSSC